MTDLLLAKQKTLAWVNGEYKFPETPKESLDGRVLIIDSFDKVFFEYPKAIYRPQRMCLNCKELFNIEHSGKGEKGKIYCSKHCRYVWFYWIGKGIVKRGKWVNKKAILEPRQAE